MASTVSALLTEATATSWSQRVAPGQIRTELSAKVKHFRTSPISPRHLDALGCSANGARSRCRCNYRE